LDVVHKIPHNIETKSATASAGKVFVFFIDQPMRYQAGERFQYNNTGYDELDRLPENCANAYIYDKERKEQDTNI
jgi:hypothetical protein